MNNKTLSDLICAGLILMTFNSLASDLFVDGANGSDSNSGATVLTPKQTIQSAINCSMDGDVIYVASGSYDPICATNRAITIIGRNGPGQSFIDAHGNGRCVTIVTSSNKETVVIGFTIQNGKFEEDGGGVLGGVIERCIIRDCVASGYHSGGAAAYAKLYNSLLYGNSAVNGGACVRCAITSCTITGNSAHSGYGGGCHYCYATNSIVTANTELYHVLSYESSLNVFEGDPLFVDAEKADYRLSSNSPCIDAGCVAGAHGDKDLNGNQRVINGVVDIGCYEYGVPDVIVSPNHGTVFNAVSQQVSMTCKADEVTIYYTIDGSEPSARNGRVYKGPFDIYQTTTVKAIAVKDDWNDSEVASATFTKENGLSEAINLLDVLPDNDKSHPWVVDTDVSHDGVSSARSGAIEDEETTTLKVALYGAGRLSFWWKTQCEESYKGNYYDCASFSIGSGEPVARLAGDSGWVQFVTNITDDAKHTFKWTYSKDDSGTVAQDCLWLDRVQWLSAEATDETDHTLTTETPVPYTWLDKYGLGRMTDFESAAKAKSGKFDGSGRELTVEEEYIAGTDPTNAASRLQAFVDLSEGFPNVTWKPDLNENGAKAIRTYKVWGKEALDDGVAWEYPTNSLHHFFKVTVEIRDSKSMISPLD